MKDFIYAVAIFVLPLNCFAQEMELTNKHFWNTTSTTATPEKIWDIWTDVSRWKDWDTGLKDAFIKEPFELHAKGVIISLEERSSKFKVVQLEKGISYTIKTRLPLGALYVKRYMVTQEGITHFTHEVWFTGITKGIFGKSLGKKFRAMLPVVLGNIKEIAENDGN